MDNINKIKALTPPRPRPKTGTDAPGVGTDAAKPGTDASGVGTAADGGVPVLCTYFSGDFAQQVHKNGPEALQNQHAVPNVPSVPTCEVYKTLYLEEKISSPDPQAAPLPQDDAFFFAHEVSSEEEGAGKVGTTGTDACTHLRQFQRPTGVLLCLECSATLAPGGTTWQAKAQPSYCADGQHEPYPPEPSMPGIMQCQRCSHVWRVEVDDGDAGPWRFWSETLQCEIVGAWDEAQRAALWRQGIAAYTREELVLLDELRTADPAGFPDKLKALHQTKVLFGGTLDREAVFPVTTDAHGQPLGVTWGRRTEAGSWLKLTDPYSGEVCEIPAKGAPHWLFDKLPGRAAHNDVA